MPDAARLSVIVPCHNAERYLPACLDSLVAQTRPIDEILFIDDGSTDGSAAIIERYARAHPAIRIVRGPQRGAGAARNAGLEHASGNWIGFVDADDMLEPGMYERLLTLALANDLDMALCNARFHFEGREPDRLIYAEAALPGPVTGAQWLAHKLESRVIHHGMWMHLNRRSLIEGLRFVEGVLHEDVTWTTRCLVRAKRVAYVHEPLYVYRRQPRELTREQLDKRLQQVIYSATTDARLLDEIASNCGDPRLARAIRWQLVDGGLSAFHKIRQLSTAELRREQWKKVLAEGYFKILWRNASDARQKRKVASRYARAVAMRVLT